MKLYIDEKKKEYINAILVCKKCKREYPENKMEEHVRTCKGEQPGYT